MVFWYSLAALAWLSGAAPAECERLARSQSWTAAEGCYTKALSQNPSPAVLHGAVELLRKSLAVNGPDPARVYNLGLALLRIGQPQEALTVLRKHPAQDAAQYALTGAAWRAVGDLDKALEALDRATSLEPSSDAYRSDYILALLRAGRDDVASMELQRAAADFPKSARIHGAQGVFAFGKGAFDDAVKHFRAAIALEPGAGEWQTSLGDVHAATGDLDGANQAYSSAIQAAPADASIYVKRGRVLLRLGRNAGAVTDWQRALRLDPTDLEAHFELGKLAAAAADDKSALLHLEKVAASPEAPPEVFYQLSRVYKRVGRTKESAVALKQFQERRKAMQDSDR